MNAKHDEKIRETQLANGARGFIDQFNYPRRQSTELPRRINKKIAPRPTFVEAFGLEDAWRTWTQDQLAELCATILRNELLVAPRCVPARQSSPALVPNHSFRAQRLAEQQSVQEPSFRAIARQRRAFAVVIRKRRLPTRIWLSAA
jgi:hypothetical protein